MNKKRAGALVKLRRDVSYPETVKEIILQPSGGIGPRFRPFFKY